MLDDPDQKYVTLLRWENREVGIFKIMEPNDVAVLWGRKKNSDNMTYDKMSRALRYYYKANVLSKCGRLCYRFHWNNVPNVDIQKPSNPKTEVLIKEDPGNYHQYLMMPPPYIHK